MVKRRSLPTQLIRRRISPKNKSNSWEVPPKNNAKRIIKKRNQEP